jgi:hypothetical protein
MKDFKNYVGTEESKIDRERHHAETAQKSGAGLPEGAKLSDFDPKDVNAVKNLAEQYSGNRDKLASDIVALAARNTAEGKLNNADLEKFEKKLSPMLSAEQKRMLNGILKALKD